MKTMEKGILIAIPSILAGLFVGSSADAASPPRLYALETASAAAKLPAALVEYHIEVHPEALRASAATLEVELPGEAPRDLLGVFKGRGWRGSVTWFGRADATARGTAIDSVLTARGEALSGLLVTADGTYQIVPAAGGEHRLARIEPSRFPPCAGGIPAPRRQRLSSSVAAATATARPPDPPGVTDVMAVFTPQARIDAGGVPQIEAVIQNAVDVANAAYLNSEIETRLRLLHVEEVAYTESGSLQADLLWAASDAAVATVRDAVGADLVSLVVASGDRCGTGFVQTDPDPSFASSAFHATRLDCAVGNLSLAHEIGHNQGCEHNPGDSPRWPDGASYPWSFGHAYDGAYRTVMALDTYCVAGCPRELHFSNAGGDFAGLPTGVADERENYRTVNATAAIVANFRQRPEVIFADGFEAGGLDSWSCDSESPCAEP